MTQCNSQVMVVCIEAVLKINNGCRAALLISSKNLHVHAYHITPVLPLTVWTCSVIGDILAWSHTIRSNLVQSTIGLHSRLINLTGFGVLTVRSEVVQSIIGLHSRFDGLDWTF